MREITLQTADLLLPSHKLSIWIEGGHEELESHGTAAIKQTIDIYRVEVSITALLF